MKKFLSLALALVLCMGLSIPVDAYEVSNAGEYVTISAGTDFTAAIKEDGSLWMWGNNQYGQLGNGGISNMIYTISNTGPGVPIQTVPTKVLDGVVSVSCGNTFTAAIKKDGSLWMWGDNGQGQLGIGGWEDSNIPVKVMDDVVAVSCGYDHTAAIKSDGSLWAWGGNIHGEVGNGRKFNESYTFLTSTQPIQSLPVKIMDDVSAVSCGVYVTAAIKTDGSLWMWGCSQYGSGRFGVLSNMGVWNYVEDYDEGTRYQTVPAKIMDDVAEVCCTHDVLAVIKNDNSLWMCGDNSLGQIGNGRSGTYLNLPMKGSVPIQTALVKIMDNVRSVSYDPTGITAAIKTDGSLWMWGYNTSGHLGLGKNVGNDSGPSYELIQTVPMKVTDDVCAVSIGHHTIAVKTDGTLWAWGRSDRGQVGTGSRENVYEPVQVSTNVLIPKPQGEPVAGFSDVHESDYFAEAVKWAKTNSITGGTSATTFSPNNTVTRAEAVTFLWRAAGSPQPTSAVSPFADVIDTSAYYYNAVLWAAEQGITGGIGNNQFGLYGTLTYDQILAMLCRASGETATGGDWSAAAVNWAAANGLTDGLTFTAKGNCPRADVVYCLWKQLA